MPESESDSIGNFSFRTGGFEPGREGDSDETEGHVTPVDITRSVNAPAGQWVDVPQGMVAAPGTYVDDKGVLRAESDDSCVVWHVPGCEVKGIQPEQIIYDVAGAPWCEKCYMSFEAKREAVAEKERLREMFNERVKRN